MLECRRIRSASKAGVIGMVKSAGKEYATTDKISVTNIRTILLVILVAIKFQIFLEIVISVYHDIDKSDEITVIM